MGLTECYFLSLPNRKPLTNTRKAPAIAGAFLVSVIFASSCELLRTTRVRISVIDTTAAAVRRKTRMPLVVLRPYFFVL